MMRRNSLAFRLVSASALWSVVALVAAGFILTSLYARTVEDAFVGVRKAARRAGRPVRILMDLGGPKLRTGPIADGQGVVKLKPERDALGTVTAPARLGLRAVGSGVALDAVDAVLAVDAAWLEPLDVTPENFDSVAALAAYIRRKAATEVAAAA